MEPEFIFSTVEARALVERIKGIREDMQIHTAIALAVWLTYIFSRSPIEWVGALEVAQRVAENYLASTAEEKEEE